MGLLDRLKTSAKDGARRAAVEAKDRARAAAAGRPSTLSSYWPQWTTLGPCGEDGWQEVRGESNYQPALEAAASGRVSDGGRRTVVVAELVREPKNKYDRNAVRVDVDGRAVGYIPREDARRYDQPIRTLAKAGKPATCVGLLSGGWDRGRSDRGSFGINLDCSPTIRTESAPFIPGEKHLLVSTLDDAVDESAIFGGRQELERVATLTNDGDRLKVWLGNEPLGWATPKSSAPLLPFFDRVAAAGFPTSCVCLLSRPSTTKKRTFDAHVLVPRVDGWRFGDE